MASTSLLLATLALMMLAVTVQAQAPPQNKYVRKVKACYEKGDAGFIPCAQAFLGEIAPNIAVGIPELGIPSMDPMAVDDFQFVEQGTVMQANALYFNMTSRGSSNYQVKSLAVDKVNKTMSVQTIMPALYITGLYVMTGSVLVLPIDGNGSFVLNLTGVETNSVCYFIRHGGRIILDKVDVSFTIQDIKMTLSDLLNDPVGDAIRKMVNDNSQEILNEIRPQITKMLSNLLTVAFKEAFVDMPGAIVGL